MIIIGEKLNSSIPRTLEAFQTKNTKAVVALIEAQVQGGADFLDINTAICGAAELETLLWVIGLVKEHSECGIMIDSTNPAIIAQAVNSAKDRALILNSTTITDRFDEVVPLAKEAGAAIVGLPIDDEGMPATLEEKCAKIDKLIKKLRDAGISDEQIYVDVLVETLATDGESAKKALGAVAHTARYYPDIKTTCGLSNISFGLPKRALINSAFISAAMTTGLSSAIIDPASPSMQAALAASRVVAGQDDYCMDYITFIRAGEEE